MNNKVIVVISTFIAAIVLVQLVSKDQPNSTIKEEVPFVNNKPESNFIQIGNLTARLPDNWNVVKPSSSMRLMEFQIGENNFKKSC